MSCASLVFGRFAGPDYHDTDSYTPPREWTRKEVDDKIAKTLDENAEFLKRMSDIHGSIVFDFINYKVEETTKAKKLCGGIHDILNGRWSDDDDFGELISMFKEMSDNQEISLNWPQTAFVVLKSNHELSHT